MPRPLLYPALLMVIACAVFDVLLARVTGASGFAVSSAMLLGLVLVAFSGRLFPVRALARGYAYLSAFVLATVPACIVLFGVPWSLRSHALQSLLLLVLASAMGFNGLFRFIQRLRNLPAPIDYDPDDPNG